MADLVNPHFAFPFRFGRGGVPCVEQDSPEEIQQSAEMALRWRRGNRLGLPDYGLPPQEMRMGGADLTAITAAVARFEDRVVPNATRDQMIRDAVDRVQAELIVDVSNG